MNTVLEKKLTLSGDVKQYACELVRLDDGSGILRYVVDRSYTIGPVRLSPGDVTYAFFWQDRPYTLYTWAPGPSRALVYYFNIADSVSLSPEEFVWRDLAVDILVDDAGDAHVLDEHELPPDIPADLSAYIAAAARAVRESSASLIREIGPLAGELHRQGSAS